MRDSSNKLIAVEDIVAKLTVEDMLALTSRVTAGPKGEPGAGFGVEIVAKSTGLPVTETLATFWSQAVAEGLENKWGDEQAKRCPMHRAKRRYLALNPWVCTCGWVFWHNLGIHADYARTNELGAETREISARTQAAAEELLSTVIQMRKEMAEERRVLESRKQMGEDELAEFLKEIGQGGWPAKEAS